MTAKNTSSLTTSEIRAILLDIDKLKDQEKYVQVISTDLMIALKEAAHRNNTEFEVELVSRLLATMIEPNAFGFSPTLDKIIHSKSSHAQAKIEKDLNQRAWGRLYELQKLELFLRLKKRMPKSYKENFFVIDVAKETKRIQAELAKEQKSEEK